MNYIVKRSEWLRGEGGVVSCLLRSSDHKRCCIGFVGQQLGIRDGALAGQRTAIDTKVVAWPTWMLMKSELINVSETDIDKAYRINDAQCLTDEQREVELKEIFASNGDTIEFVD